jgi:hypothetical protein
MMARRFIMAFGWLIIGIGLWALIQPHGLVDFADLFLTSAGLWVAVALRIGVGTLLWVAAPESRFPRTLRILGALFVVSGVALPIVGLARMQAIAEWGAALDPLWLRAVALLTTGIGAFLIVAVMPRKSEQ